MLNNFLWTFAKFKTWNFAFSGTWRLGLNLVFGRDFSWWAENRIHGVGWRLQAVFRFPPPPHLIISPWALLAGPSSGPVAGFQDSSFTLWHHQPWLRARDLAPATGRNLGWTKTKAGAANLGWQLLTKFTFSSVAERFASPKWRNKCQFEQE